MSRTANLNHLLSRRHLDAGRGEDLAVIDGTGRWSFAELDRAAGSAAAALLAAGIRHGDRVAIALPDSRAWCAAFLGTTRIGAVAVPLEPGGRHLETILQDLEPQLLITADLNVAPNVPHMNPETLTGHPPEDPHPVRPDDLAYMIFSSGSTGHPKGAMHAHRDLEASVEGYANEILELGPTDRCHSIAHLFSSLGFGNGFFRPLGRGAACVLSATTPSVRAIGALVVRHGVTVLTAVPTFWSQLATFLERHPVDNNPFSGVRIAVSSGDSLPAAVAKHLETVTGMALIEGLGCSECSNIVISNRPGEHVAGTVGRAVAGVEIRLADANGAPVAAGSPGRLWIKSPSNTTGYWRRPDETAELLHGDWIRMGDVLREDAGVYRHLGRSDDLFKVDAQWVSPIEVEGVLHEHPAVSEAAVIGRPNFRGLIRADAFVVLVDDAPPNGLADELRRHVAHRLAPYMAPANITFVPSLPRGATGKLDRRALATANQHPTGR